MIVIPITRFPQAKVSVDADFCLWKSSEGRR
jgi:hypothetical protein